MEPELKAQLEKVAGVSTPKPVAKKPIAKVAVKKKQAVGEVEITQADGTKTNEVEKVGEAKHFVEAPCTVEIGASYKLGLPHYSSAECRVTLTVPCAPGEIDEVADFAEAWVDKRMQIAQELLQAAKAAS